MPKLNELSIVNNQQMLFNALGDAVGNPYHYGAVGDGVTDDSTAFMDMFAGGKSLNIIPPGTFLIDAIEQPPDSQVLAADQAVLSHANSEGVMWQADRGCHFIGGYLLRDSISQTYTGILISTRPDATVQRRAPVVMKTRARVLGVAQGVAMRVISDGAGGEDAYTQWSDFEVTADTCETALQVFSVNEGENNNVFINSNRYRVQTTNVKIGCHVKGDLTGDNPASNGTGEYHIRYQANSLAERALILDGTGSNEFHIVLHDWNSSGATGRAIYAPTAAGAQNTSNRFYGVRPSDFETDHNGGTVGDLRLGFTNNTIAGAFQDGPIMELDRDVVDETSSLFYQHNVSMMRGNFWFDRRDNKFYYSDNSAIYELATV